MFGAAPRKRAPRALKSGLALLFASLLPSCILFIDLESLGTGKVTVEPPAEAGPAETGASTADAGSDGEGGSRFCSAFTSAAVCEDFDQGKANPALTYLPELDANGGEMTIASDVAASAPSALFISIRKNDYPNIREFLVVTSPRTGTRTNLRFAFRPVTTDYIFFGIVECELQNGDFDGLYLRLSPDGSIGLNHSYDANEVAIGSVEIGTFSPFELSMSEVTGALKGTIKVGETTTEVDRPIACKGGGAHRVRLGIEGAGGKASVAFDNLVYDITP
jgi:hypothetical protein